jgi:prepilin peptidase CpaA
VSLQTRDGALAELGGAQWGLLPALASLPWLTQAYGPAAAKAACFLLLAVLMASYDLASRRIPNPLNLLAALAGLSWALAAGGAGGMIQALGGGLAAFGLMLAFHLFGAVGAGDVKALGGLGCFLAPWAAVELFVATALAGGALAGVRLAAAKASRRPAAGLTLPYGVAIAAGAFTLALSGGLP